ncbi:MAG: ParB/RepB/Spo0J family partition protein [Candidatus Margulisiibacteriota bacterium]
MVKRGLGRGLDVLIPQKSGLTAGRTIMEISVSLIKPNPFQARKTFDEQRITELASSIQEHGVIQPIVVRKAVDGGYELVAGERRLRASKQAGAEKIPAIIKDIIDEESMEIGLIENLQRENLNAIEEAKAFKRLAEEFNLTQEQIAKKAGKSRSVIANAMRLLNLPEEIQESIQSGLLSSGHGRTLVSIIDSTQQQSIWKQMLGGNFNVRQAEAVTSKAKKKTNRKTTEKKDIVLNDLAETLSRHLSTKVIIKGGRERGILSIHYYNQSDLERIVETIG